MDVYSILLADETIRGERVAWVFRWILYVMVVCLASVVYWVQGNPAGLPGIILAVATLIYNALLTPLILRHQSPTWVRYVSVSIDILALTTYNIFDTLNNPLIPVTSATLVLYPLLLFLASLRLDKVLIVYSTILAVVSLDLLYVWAAPRFEPHVGFAISSIDALSQVYRSAYILTTGLLMLFIPGTIRRLLKSQQEIFEKSRDNYERAHRDRLTGLDSRYHFEEVLPRELARAQAEGVRLGLIYLDLDGFKPVNDQFGHATGDLVLAEVGRRLREGLRGTDLAARMGGDEFVIMATSVEGPSACEALAERVRQSLSQPMDLGGQRLQIGATTGWALYPDDADTPAGLLARADRAMLARKHP